MRQAVRAIVMDGDRLLVMKRNKFGSEFYTLIGGGVDLQEDLESALRRELREEVSLEVGQVKLVFVEEAGEPYGTQYIYWCEYKGGDPILGANTEEAKISAMGQNTYEPMWIPLAELPGLLLRSGSAKEALQHALKNGFPSSPVLLEWKPER